MPDEEKPQLGFWDIIRAPGFLEAFGAAYRLLPSAMGIAAEQIAGQVGVPQPQAEAIGGVVKTLESPVAQAASTIVGGVGSLAGNGAQTEESKKETEEIKKETEETKKETEEKAGQSNMSLLLIAILVIAIIVIGIAL